MNYNLIVGLLHCLITFVRSNYVGL